MAHQGSDNFYGFPEKDDLFPEIRMDSSDDRISGSQGDETETVSTNFEESSEVNGLFPAAGPSLFPGVRSSLASAYSTDTSDSSSTNRFRQIFHRHQGDLSSEECASLQHDRHSMTDVETTTSSIPPSFDSQIVDKIAHTQKEGKRNYLEEYQNIYKTEGDTESMFGLSKLDDYSRFLKTTKLNDLLSQKVHLKSSRDSATLDVMTSKDMKERFYTGEGMHELDYSSNVYKKRKVPWYRKDRWKNKVNVVEEIEQKSSSSVSSNVSKDYLQRKLKVRHLQMISLGATLGVGLILNSGKCFTIAGGLGTVLAFMICGTIVFATVISFCEMVTFVSIIDGVSGLSSRFVNDSFGFATGWLYFLSYSVGLAGEIVASVIMISYYPYLDVTNNRGISTGFVTLFLLLVLISNLTDVRVFGEVEYVTSLVKVFCALCMIVIMIVLNRGGFGSDVLGFRYWTYLKSNFEHNIIYGVFRPSFNLHDNGTNDPSEGIVGNAGRFLSLISALSVCAYAYSGSEIVCIAACESKNPRKALPSATKRVFWRILIFYCLSAFMVSINIYSGDPRLLRYYLGTTGVSSSQYESNYAINYVGGANCHTNSAVFAGYGSGSQSPWIVALLSVNLCKFSSVVNGFMVFFAISCGNAQLYVSSRTVYSLALQGMAPRFLVKCNRLGIPYNAVLFSASFGLLSYICVSEKATLVFQYLTSIIASSGILIWFAMCLSFLRFYYGLKKRPDIISRDDRAYPYKSAFQPYSAYVGLIGSAFIILIMGFVVFIPGEWNTLFFFSSYGSLFMFAVLYIGHKLVKGSITPSLEILDFDSGRREMDQYIWDGEDDKKVRSFKDMASRAVYFFA